MYQSQLTKGKYYNIICKANDQALRIQQDNPLKYEKSRIISAKVDAQDNCQLFMIDKVGEKDDEYQIINCVSSFVFDQQSGEIRLRAGKQNRDQLFAIIPAPIQSFYKYYWLKTQVKGNKALILQGLLRYTQFDPNNEAQLFRFVSITDNNTLETSSIIINQNSDKAIDIPKSSRKEGERIIQWQRHNKFNQRWQFVRQGKGFILKNICGESRQNGGKIIQWVQTGHLNQQWYPQVCGNNIYKFRSCLEHSLFLAIRKQKLDDLAQLQVSNQQNPSMYWKVQGALPKH